MFTLWDNFALFGAISMFLAFVPLAIMASASARGFEDSVLCMDCQQCMAVCPVREELGADYMGPRGIMQTARAGNWPMAEEGRLFSCTSCMNCTPACPRGLNVEHQMDRSRWYLAKQGLGQMKAHKGMISRINRYGNPYSDDKRNPAIETQAQEIKKQIESYGKRVGMKIFEEEATAVATAETETETET